MLLGRYFACELVGLVFRLLVYYFRLGYIEYYFTVGVSLGKNLPTLPTGTLRESTNYCFNLGLAKIQTVRIRKTRRSRG